MLRRYCTIARLARITISASTTINSMIVKPRLPVLVLRPIKRSPVRGRADVEHILPAPGGGVGVVLVRPQAPFGRLDHRVDRYASQEPDFATGHIVRGRYAFDQRLQRFRIPLAAGLDLEGRDLAEIRRILELVDRGAHFAKRPPELGFTLPRGRHFRQRHRRRRENDDDGRHHEQLDKGVAARTDRTHHRYCCTVTTAGRNCTPIGVPPEPVPVPLTDNVTGPAATASIINAAINPVPVAPVASLDRTMVISTRPGAIC